MCFILTMSSLEDRLADVQRSAKRRKLLAKSKEGAKNKKADESAVKSKMRMYALFSKGAYMRKSDNRQKILDDYKIGYTLDQRESTKDIAIYKKNDGVLSDDPDVVMAFRGTKYFRDVLADKKITMSEIEKSGRFKKSYKLFQKVFNQSVDNDKTMVVTGHSLGGSIAAAIGRLDTIPSITFNPGSGASVLTKDQHMGNSVQYTTNGSDQADPISWLSSVSSRPGEEVVTVGENKLKSIFPKFSLDAHSLSNFLPEGASKSYWDDVDKEDAAGYTWKEDFDEALETVKEYAEDEVDDVKAIPGELTGGEGSKPFYENVITDVGVGGGILGVVAALVKRKKISAGAASIIRGMVKFATMPAGATASGITGFVKGVFSSPKRMFQFMKKWHNSPQSTRAQLGEYIGKKIENIRGRFGTAAETEAYDNPFSLGEMDDVESVTWENMEDDLFAFDEDYNIDGDFLDDVEGGFEEVDVGIENTGEVDPDISGMSKQDIDDLIAKYDSDPDDMLPETEGVEGEPLLEGKLPETPSIRLPDVTMRAPVGEGGEVGEGLGGVMARGGKMASRAFETIAETTVGKVAGEIGGAVGEIAGPVGGMLAVGLPVYFYLHDNGKRDHITKTLKRHHKFHGDQISIGAERLGYNPDDDIKKFIEKHPDTKDVLTRPDGDYDYDAYFGPYGSYEYLDWRLKNKKALFGKGLGVRDSLESIRSIMNPYNTDYVKNIKDRREMEVEVKAPKKQTTGTVIGGIIGNIVPGGNVNEELVESLQSARRVVKQFDFIKNQNEYITQRLDKLQDVYKKNTQSEFSTGNVWEKKAPVGKTFRYSSSTKTYVHIDATGQMSHKVTLSDDDKRILTSYRGKGAILHSVEELNDKEFDYLTKQKQQNRISEEKYGKGKSKADYEHPKVWGQFGGSVTGAPHSKPSSRSSEKDTHGGGQPEIDKWRHMPYNRNEHGGPLSDTHRKHTNDGVSHKADKRDGDSNATTTALQNATHGNGTGLPHGNPTLGPRSSSDPDRRGWFGDDLTKSSNPKTGNMRTNAGIGGATQPLGGVPVNHVHTATAHPKSTPAHQVTPGDTFDPFQSTLGSENTFSSSNNQGISLRQIHLKSHLDNKWNQTALTAASDVNFMRVMNAREGNW
jgi:hypothetical protein